jgi:hypothetical protein
MALLDRGAVRNDIIDVHFRRLIWRKVNQMMKDNPEGGICLPRPGTSITTTTPSRWRSPLGAKPIRMPGLLAGPAHQGDA